MSGAPQLGLYSVFDGTGAHSPLNAGNVLLLAASWRAQVADRARHPLVIRAIRVRNERLLRKLEQLGARIEPVERPHRLNGYSATYNKLLGLLDQGKDEARLLLDNDMAFVSDVAPLEADAREFVMADFADRQRVKPEVIAEIRDRLGLELPKGEWRPMKERYEALASGREPPAYQDMYFSSGAVVSPLNSELPRAWEEHSARICAQFKDRYQKQKQRGAFGSDQLGLATAVHAQPRFRLLPPGYNYRMFGFLCGHLPLERIHIVHHVAIRRAYTALLPDQQASLVAILRSYYDGFIIDKMRADGLPDAEARSAIASEARDRVLAVIRDSGIDDLRQAAADREQGAPA